MHEGHSERWPIVGGLLILAAALVVHALVPRYQAVPMQGVVILRTDRWTGTVQLCRGSLSAGAFICGGPPLAQTPNPSPTP